jgi:hypothetical protein
MDDDYGPIFNFFGWELWPWTDDSHWMLTHDRLIMAEWRKHDRRWREPPVLFRFFGLRVYKHSPFRHWRRT